ncbi:hypothetical protein JCM6882_005735 [Rhodosporidiobolus microsporus]
MTGLFSSLAEIIEGFIHAILAVIGTALNVVRTFLKETIGLAAETTEFVLRNFLVLGLIGALFIGYQLYNQNTARVKTRTEKKLR